MNLPANLFATAFKRQRLGAMLSIVLAIMVYMGSLAVAGQVALARTSIMWGLDLQSKLTVEIESIPGESAQAEKDRLAQAVTVMERTPEVERVRTLPENETMELLRPWITDPALLSSLPLPKLIDVYLYPGKKISPEDLGRSLSKVVSGAQVHAHAEWMQALLGFLRGLSLISTLMLALTAVALIIMTAIICRAAMAIQHDTIELLHFMGATDAAIARQFQGHVRSLSFTPSVIGFVLACLTLGFLAASLKVLGGLSLIAPLSWVAIGLGMLAVPCVAILLSLLTARLSVLRFLRRLL